MKEKLSTKDFLQLLIDMCGGEENFLDAWEQCKYLEEYAKAHAGEKNKKDQSTYFILDKEKMIIKIGRSQSPTKRLQQLRTSNPHLVLIGYIKSDIESTLHQKFKNYQIDLEWFECSNEIINFILDNKDMIFIQNNKPLLQTL